MSILFIFSKKSLLVSLVFSVFFFLPPLCLFPFFFLRSTNWVHLFSFCSSFKCKDMVFFEIFLLYFLMWALITIPSLLEMLLLHLINLVCFIFIFICQKIFLNSPLLSSLTHWFFRSLSFSHHIFMNFPVFLL